MMLKLDGYLVIFLFFRLIAGYELCSETEDLPVKRILCQLDKRRTFGPWAGKRNDVGETNGYHEQREFKIKNNLEFPFKPSKWLDEQPHESDTELVRSLREFSSWGGKRDSVSTDQTQNIKSKADIFSCLRQYSGQIFKLTRCIQSANQNCKSDSCEWLQKLQRRDFSAWGGW